MSTSVHRAGELSPEEERFELAKRVEEGMSRLSARLEDLPEDELDRLLDEAVHHARHPNP